MLSNSCRALSLALCCLVGCHGTRDQASKVQVEAESKRERIDPACIQVEITAENKKYRLDEVAPIKITIRNMGATPVIMPRTSNHLNFDIHVVFKSIKRRKVEGGGGQFGPWGSFPLTQMGNMEVEFILPPKSSLEYSATLELKRLTDPAWASGMASITLTYVKSADTSDVSNVWYGTAQSLPLEIYFE